MCICSASFFLSLPVRPSSENCRWRIKHSRSIHGARCYFGAIDSCNFTFLGKFRCRVKSSEEDVVLDSSDFLGNDSAELIRVENENDPRNNGSRGFKQMTNRSNLVAKQVISIQSALSLGFISQLWVDTNSWLVLVVDVKPSLLSGESERFLLKDIVRDVGDVVLVEDEAVLATEFKMVGLETLVSTYRLDVEDIIEALEDVVVVHEAAASRKQRLTKGLWDAQFGSEYSDIEELESSSERRRQRRSNKSSRKKRNFDDDEWDIFR